MARNCKYCSGVTIVRNEGTIVFGNVVELSPSSNTTSISGPGSENEGEVVLENGRSGGNGGNGGSGNSKGGRCSRRRSCGKGSNGVSRRSGRSRSNCGGRKRGGSGSKWGSRRSSGSCKQNGSYRNGRKGCRERTQTSRSSKNKTSKPILFQMS